MSPGTSPTPAAAAAALDASSAYDYNDLAFYIKWAREAGTPDEGLMQLPRLAFLAPAERRALIDRVVADPAYQRPRRVPLALPIVCFFILLPLSIFLTARAASVLIDRWAIDRAFGLGTYDRGVRLADKRGKLTDGRWLEGGTWRLRSAAVGAAFFGSAVLYGAVYYRIFGDRKDRGPSLNGHRLHLLLLRRRPPGPPPTS